MTQRRTAIRGVVRPDPAEGEQPRAANTITTPLRWRLALVTSSMVALAVAAMTLMTYWSVSTTLINGVDRDLDRMSTLILEQTFAPFSAMDLDGQMERFRTYYPETRLAIYPPGWAFPRGDDIPLGLESIVVSAPEQTSFHSVGSERIVVKTADFGSTVILARDLTELHTTIASLGTVLLLIASLGLLLAIITGAVVATAGLVPLQRLQKAVLRVTETDNLQPIAVDGNDELAQLTRSFNEMLAALQESRNRQAQLVADAGHELKTPLTSMRTNIELLMLLNRPGNSHRITEEDRRDLERDVLAQMEEMSSLIGDLVDLAREEATDTVVEDLDLEQIVVESLERVRRRRSDVEFAADLVPCAVRGDGFTLARAVTNLLDNAAKWSPSGGVVRVRLVALPDDFVALTVADSGPGIPKEDRQRVFERFYRSPEARSQPGSGLGLAIVKQTVVRHGGAITVEDSDDGGACIRVVLPSR